jgi:hypothetical protein
MQPTSNVDTRYLRKVGMYEVHLPVRSSDALTCGHAGILAKTWVRAYYATSSCIALCVLLCWVVPPHLLLHYSFSDGRCYARRQGCDAGMMYPECPIESLLLSRAILMRHSQPLISINSTDDPMNLQGESSLLVCIIDF